MGAVGSNLDPYVGGIEPPHPHPQPVLGKDLPSVWGFIGPKQDQGPEYLCAYLASLPKQ